MSDSKSAKISEDAIELLAIERLKAQGYRHSYGPDIAHDGETPERASFDGLLLRRRIKRPFLRSLSSILHLCYNCPIHWPGFLLR